MRAEEVNLYAKHSEVALHSHVTNKYDYCGIELAKNGNATVLVDSFW